jgi:hypothetical protein
MVLYGKYIHEEERFVPNILKKIAYFFIGCILAGFVLAAIISSFPVFQYMAKGFLIAVSNNQYQQAYSMLSKDFQRRNDMPTFKTNVEQSGLDQYKQVIWITEEGDTSQPTAKIRGVVFTKTNTKIAVEIQFVKEVGKDWMDKGWRIDNIKILPADEVALPQLNVK